jgi:N-glycosylase/DNA lyase
MLVSDSKIFSDILSEYSLIQEKFNDRRNWRQMSEDELWHELCLCILSSNIPYELAVSAFQHLRRIGYLSQEWIANTDNAEQLIASELRRPIFYPKKIDGNYRKYRFPNVRSKNICSTARVISSTDCWFYNLLSKPSSEVEIRNYLAHAISGFGLKEASHFLRNIKYSSELAIIDTHIVNFLSQLELIPTEKVTVTKKVYVELEDKMRQICRSNQLNLSILDMAIWYYMRGRSQ